MKNFVLFLVIFLAPKIYAQKASDAAFFQVGFYNLENLFDTLHDNGKEDYEFLPASQHKWNTERYETKLHYLARSISSMNDWEGPDILGVCEVEHKTCLDDLVQKTALKQFNYEVIHEESSDLRGIDVACIYKKDRFTPVLYQYIRVDLGEDARPTRDILYVKGLVFGEDTLHLFFNHWPSRMGGVGASEPKRIEAAKTLRLKVDSILAADSNAKIVITGDFNDGTDDISISKYLVAKKDTFALQPYLYNTSYQLKKQGLGTHKYQDEWNLFDQQIISSGLLDVHSSLSYIVGSSKINSDKEWLNEADQFSVGYKPKRTYVGTTYNKGYSDHYSVSICLRVSR